MSYDNDFATRNQPQFPVKGRLSRAKAMVFFMETRVAVMSIIVESPDSVEPINSLLHEHGQYIIGRMGIPYRERGISIISIALDAPDTTISALAGRIGNLPGVSVKTAYSGVKGVPHG